MKTTTWHCQPLLAFVFFFLLQVESFSQQIIVAKTPIQLYDEAKSLLPNKPKEAEPILQQSLLLALEDLRTDSMVAKSYYLLGVANYYMSKLIIAEQYFKKALQTKFGMADEKMQEGCLNNLGVIYDKQDRLTDALDAYNKSLKLAEKRVDSFSIVQSWINLSLLHHKKGRVQEGLTLCDQVIRYSTLHGDTLNLALALQNRGLIFASIGEQEKGYADYSQSHILFSSLKDDFNGIAVLINLADIERKRGNFAKATVHLEEASSLESAKDIAEHRVGINIQRALLASDGREFAKAVSFLKAAESAAMAVGNEEFLLNIREELVDVYARSGNYPAFKMAMDQFKKYVAERNRKEDAESYEQISVLYGLDKALAQNETLSLEMRQNKRILLLLLVFLTVLLAASGVIGLQYIRLRQSTRSLFQLNLSQLKGLSSKASSLTASGSASADTEQSPSEQEEAPATSAKREGVDISYSKERYHQLVHFMEAKRPFLDPEMNIQTLVHELGISQKLISQAISEHSGTNFSGFVNGFRINEARRLLIERGAELRVDEIADLSGFNNRVSFYNHFKEATGFTPARFAKLATDAAFVSKNR